MDEDYNDKELKKLKKAELIPIIMEQEELIIELTPNARKHGSHPEEELTALRHPELINLLKKNQVYIAKIRAANVIAENASNYAAYGEKGITKERVAQLQFEKSM